MTFKTRAYSFSILLSINALLLRASRVFPAEACEEFGGANCLEEGVGAEVKPTASKSPAVTGSKSLPKFKDRQYLDYKQNKKTYGLSRSLLVSATVKSFTCMTSTLLCPASSLARHATNWGGSFAIKNINEMCIGIPNSPKPLEVVKDVRQELRSSRSRFQYQSP